MRSRCCRSTVVGAEATEEPLMSRELRTTLAIMLAVLILGAPIIFADAPQTQGTTSYLALVFQLKPSAAPTPPPPTINVGPPILTPTSTQTPLPTAIFVPTSTPTLPPPTLNGCQADPNPSAAPNYPVRITAIN